MRKRRIGKRQVGRHSLDIHRPGGTVDVQNLVECPHIESRGWRPIAVAENMRDILLQPHFSGGCPKPFAQRALLHPGAGTKQVHHRNRNAS
jgi:hypothetical protein